MPTEPFLVAVVQRPPVLLDREATIKGAVEHPHEAAAAGARLVVFPETYIPGYPVWVWELRPGGDDDLVADDLRTLREAAAERSVVVVCGVHERDGANSGATLDNTLVTIGADGTILNVHGVGLRRCARAPRRRLADRWRSTSRPHGTRATRGWRRCVISRPRVGAG